MDLRKELFENQDLKYREFHSRILATVPDSQLIGVRTPVLRKLAKEVYKQDAHNLCEYYEERIIKGFTIGMKKCGVQEHMDDMRDFIPLINCWAVCDLCDSSFKFVAKDLDAYYPFIISFIDGGEYTTRYAIVMLMSYYLNDEYIDRVLDLYKSINSDYYYVNMAIAWGLATAFVKYEKKVISLLQSKVLNKDVQNKTIQKIKDSYRVPKEVKDGLNQYKIK